MKRNILVLCHGNINRSPACAAVLATWFRRFNVRSAGFREGGNRAAKKMRDALLLYGYNLEEHRSAQVTPELVDWADCIIIMSDGNLARFRQLFLGALCKVERLGNWAVPSRKNIPDPAYMRRDSADFAQTVELLIQASLNFGKHYREMKG